MENNAMINEIQGTSNEQVLSNAGQGEGGSRKWKRIMFKCSRRSTEYAGISNCSRKINKSTKLNNFDQLITMQVEKMPHSVIRCIQEMEDVVAVEVQQQRNVKGSSEIADQQEEGQAQQKENFLVKTTMMNQVEELHAKGKRIADDDDSNDEEYQFQERQARAMYLDDKAKGKRKVTEEIKAIKSKFARLDEAGSLAFFQFINAGPDSVYAEEARKVVLEMMQEKADEEKATNKRLKKINGKECAISEVAPGADP